MKKVYLAAPLFSMSEFMFNNYLRLQISNKFKNRFDIYLPQLNQDINDKSKFATAKDIALADTEHVLNSDIVIAVLDGQTIDPGVASEIGIAAAANKSIIGLYTDSRMNGTDNKEKINDLVSNKENQFSYINLYTVGLVNLHGSVCHTEEELLELLEKY